MVLVLPLFPWISALHRSLAFFTTGQLLNYLGVRYHLWCSASSQLPLKPRGPSNPSPASPCQIARFTLTGTKILAWTFIASRLITVMHCTIRWPSCFPASHLQSTQKARARLLTQRHPGHIHLLCEAEWQTTHSARAQLKRAFHSLCSWTRYWCLKLKFFYGASAPQDLTQRSEAFFNHLTALTNPGQGAPQQDTPTTVGNYSPKHLFPGKGESLG